MNDEYFGVVRWHKADLESALEDHNIAVTENNIDKLFGLVNNHWFTDFMIERGWEYINEMFYMHDVSWEEYVITKEMIRKELEQKNGTIIFNNGYTDICCWIGDDFVCLDADDMDSKQYESDMSLDDKVDNIFNALEDLKHDKEEAERYGYFYRILTEGYNE